MKIAREVFGKKDDDKFVQKITYFSGDSDALIRSFRNDKDFRIAVTCTFVATGTDLAAALEMGPDDWMKKLFSSEDSGVQIPSNGPNGPFMGMAITNTLH